MRKKLLDAYCIKVFCVLFYILMYNIVAAQSPNALKTTISGTITDDDGKPLDKATVSTKDRKISTYTNSDGKFSITLDNAAQRRLVISFVGYMPTELIVGNRTVINVKLLKSVAVNLDEVVVTNIGYGTKKKTDLSGAVTEINSEFITNQNITSVDQGLAGLLPGVTLREGTGAPGAGPEILIRGINGFGNNKPLFVIDDIIFEDGNDQNNNPLALLNPEDIQSVVVLKDAASKAIYGSRANAGVILITTKKGKAGKPKISFSQNISVSQAMPFENPDVLNANELATFRKEVAIDKIRAFAEINPTNATYGTFADPKIAIPDATILGAGSIVGTAIPIANYIDPSIYGVGTNWYEAVLRNALVTNTNLSVSGGSDNMRYFISGNYLNQEGVVVYNDIKRYSLRANFDVKVNNKIKLGLGFSPSRTEANRPADDPASGQFSAYSTITSTYWVDPSVNIRQPNGLLNFTTRGTLNSNWTANPIYQLESEQEKRATTQLLTNLFIEIEPIKNLTFKSSLNYNFSTSRSTNFQPSTLVGDGSLTPVFPNVDSARAVLFNSTTNNIVNDNILRYKFNKGKHSATIMAAFTYQQNTTETSNLNARKIADENFIFPNSNNVSLNAVGNFTGSTGWGRSKFISYISRLNYSYNNKYFFDASIRRDASSRFGREVQYGDFPAASIAWKITEEKFIKESKLNWLSEFRVEASWGKTGSASGFGFGNFTYLGTIGGANYNFGGGNTVGNALTSLPNEQITWEPAEQIDLGFKASFFKRRLALTFNWFKQETTGAIAQLPLSLVTGFGNVVGNQPNSIIQNRGVEISLDYIIKQKKDFRWTVGANISTYRNVLVSYFLPNGFTNGPAGNGTNVAISKPGESLGMYRGLKIIGLYTAADIADPSVPKYTGARVGGTKFVDGNGNGTLQIGEQDYVTLGNPHPDFMFGFNTLVQYKELSIRAIFAGQVGGLIYDLRREIMWNVDGNFNVHRDVLERWRPGDDPATKSFGSTSYNTNIYRIPSDNKIYDASYIALKNLTIGYNLGKLLNKKKTLVQGAELSVSVRNVFYIAAYKFGNPETRRSNDGSALRGINYGSYPINRTISLGLNITL